MAIADAVDGAAAGAGRVEERLDLLLGLVGQLVPGAVEELDAVVLGRVVRGGDDDAEVEREQRDRRRRQHAGEHGVAARLDDAAANAASSSGPEPRVSRPTKTRPRPDQSVAALPSCSTSSTVRSSPTTPRTPSVPKYRRKSGLALGELRRLARLVEAGLLALDLACVAREEALALQRDAQLRIGLDERPGDAVANRAGLAATGRRRARGRGGRTCPRLPPS